MRGRRANNDLHPAMMAGQYDKGHTEGGTTVHGLSAREMRALACDELYRLFSDPST